jgi:beta-phosphoglucomutase-like phosphatase (HAD superfamily)
MAAVHGFGGLQVGARGIALDPILPPKWDELTYGFLFRGAQVRVTVRRNLFTVRNEGRAALPLLVQGRHESVPTNASRTFPIENHWCEPTLKAVLVALDGLLVDSGALHVKAWTAIAGDLGLSVPTETLASLGAVPTAEALKKLFADRPVPAGEAWNRAVAQVDARYREFAALTVSPASAAPVTSALCDALRRDGVKIAAVCGHAYGALLLERAGLTDRVDLVSDGNLITAGLPDPQAYAVAQQRARALPWESLAIVGDRVTAEAARRSGAVVMAVGEATVGLEPHADDLAALSLSRLREIFATVENPLDPYLELNVAKMKTELVAG